MTDGLPPTKASNRVVRGMKALKHYRNSILTQAGEPTLATMGDLILDLMYVAKKYGMDLPGMVKESEDIIKHNGD